jgi:hypothetical protein
MGRLPCRQSVGRLEHAELLVWRCMRCILIPRRAAGLPDGMAAAYSSGFRGSQRPGAGVGDALRTGRVGTRGRRDRGVFSFACRAWRGCNGYATDRTALPILRDLSYPLYMSHYAVIWIWGDYAERHNSLWVRSRSASASWLHSRGPSSNFTRSLFAVICTRTLENRRRQLRPDHPFASAGAEVGCLRVRVN